MIGKAVIVKRAGVCRGQSEGSVGFAAVQQPKRQVGMRGTDWQKGTTRAGNLEGARSLCIPVQKLRRRTRGRSTRAWRKRSKVSKRRRAYPLEFSSTRSNTYESACAYSSPISA